MSAFAQHHSVFCNNASKDFCDCFTDQIDADTSCYSPFSLCNEHELLREFPPHVSGGGQTMGSSPLLLTEDSFQSEDKREREVKKQGKCATDNIRTDEENKHKKAKKYFRKLPEDASCNGCIHVRARRGQATDSHSLAERVRREKISDRLKLLQSLVPGCENVTGKIFILDEIIKYVRSLQSQVKFLSRKLESVNPAFSNFGLESDASVFRTEQQPIDFSDSHPFDSSSPESLQRWQCPGDLYREGGNQSWDVDDEMPIVFDQSGFNRANLYFH